MTARVRSFTMLVAGPWRDEAELVASLAAHDVRARPRGDEPFAHGDIEVMIVEDDRFGDAFAFGRGGPLPDDLRQSIQRCGRAAVVEVALELEKDHARVAALGRALSAVGGLAIRMEGSGAAATWDFWLPRMESGHIRGVYECAVIVVRDEGDTLFTCGMHVFDRPDAEISMRDLRAALAWLDVFHIYSLVDDPVFASGQTFQPDADTKRRVFERWPDARHAVRDSRHNPFGVFRFLDEGTKPRQLSKLVPTIMPSLAAMLMAQERSLGRALTRKEVEAMVEKAPAMMMEREHARALERNRGYADIDPERAWEQWQIVRATQSNG